MCKCFASVGTSMVCWYAMYVCVDVFISLVHTLYHVCALEAKSGVSCHSDTLRIHPKLSETAENSPALHIEGFVSVFVRR